MLVTRLRIVPFIASLDTLFVGPGLTRLLASRDAGGLASIELDVIATAVIGGTSLQGGEGTAVGAFLGAAIMAVVRDALVLLGLPLPFQTMIIGAVVLRSRWA